MKTQIKVTELSHDELVNIFSTGLYGNHYMTADYNSADYKGLPQEKKQGNCFEDKLADMLLNGYAIKLYDLNAEGEVYSKRGAIATDNKEFTYELPEGTAVYTITLKDVLKACSTDEGYGYAKELLIDEVGDYYTAYNILQLVMFGEVIYG